MGTFDVKTDVQNLVNAKAKFGNFSASTEKLLNQHKKNSYTPEAEGNTIYFVNDKGKPVATATKDYKGNAKSKANPHMFNAKIFDYNTGRSYETGWQPTTSNKTNFTTIVGNGYRIIDNNSGNEEEKGFVDNNDYIYIDGSGEMMTVGDYLNSVS